jgi:drug/metabolite transporter (DMT)-like permease
VILLLIGLALLGFCGYRFRQDRRRLSNGVYLLLGVIFTGLWMLQSGAPGTEIPSFVIATIALLSPLLVLLLAGFLIVNARDSAWRTCSPSSPDSHCSFPTFCSHQRC